jgi:hypothetical protein
LPPLNHVVVNVRDQLSQAAEVYRWLGFTLTLQTISLDTAKAALRTGAIRGSDRIGSNMPVPATEACGAA